MVIWRWIPFEYFNAAENMAIDEALFISVKMGLSPPTLRLYGWKNPSVSIGYFQNPFTELNMGALRETGCELVRRPTGGRAVYHEEEVTYSISARIDDHKGFGTLSTTFLTIAKCFLRALEFLGLKGEIASQKRGSKGSSLCFSSTSLYEICINDEKLIGSAQRRDGSAFLQQGSFLIDFDIKKNSKIFLNSLSRESTVEKIGYLKKYINGNIKPGMVEKAIINGFEKELGICLVKSGLSDEERRVAELLVANKYTKETWNLEKRSSFLDF